MKSKRVLLGLILVTFVGSLGFTNAQTKANYKSNRLIEVGPNNVGGRVRAVVAIDAADGDHTIYVGGVAGGLYKASEFQANTGLEYIPYYENNVEVTLPISDMIKLSNGKILIATGEGYYEHGVTHTVMSPRGRGLFLFDPQTESFTTVSVTNPLSHPEFSYINKLAYNSRNGYTYLYVATTAGLYRWKIKESGNWEELQTAPVRVYDGAVQDIEVVSSLNIAFFTSGNEIHKIGNITGESNASLLLKSSTVFGDTASRIELAAAAKEGTLYLYALVANLDGYCNGVYLTHDQQNWTKLSTSTVTPFTSTTTGKVANAITIDPFNVDHVFVGGATLWSGEGFVANSNYLWNKISMSEYELNAGNYMLSVFFSNNFVHSGIHNIVPIITDTANYEVVYMIATDGGIYLMSSYTYYTTTTYAFVNLNRNLNVTQMNNVAVAPDGSVLGAAAGLAVPFIQSKMDHDGGAYNDTWYDNSSRMNHAANILWQRSGTDVATSMFQQVLPRTRRGIFVAAEGGTYGRAYSDYADFTNTQTWTSGEYFTSTLINGGQELSKMVLWETTNNTNWNDEITFTIDTTNVIYRNGQEMQLSGDFQIQAGDMIMVPAPQLYGYPIEYKFTSSFKAKDKMTHTIHSPLASRMFITGYNRAGLAHVLMTCMPSDYRKVYDTAYPEASRMAWVSVLRLREGFDISHIAVSNDADVLFVALYNKETGKHSIYRLRGLSKSDVNNNATLNKELYFETDFQKLNRITDFDTIYNGSEFEFDRPITSLSVDKRNGKDVLLITFGGYSNSAPNFAYITNPSQQNYTYVEAPIVLSGVVAASDPVYSAMVEYTKGEVYVGTDNGVLKASALSANATWAEYGAFRGVPVTAIVQQTNALDSKTYEVHDGINVERYVFAKTKYPYAMYFGTYGRGVFMDTTYVTDHVNEIVDRQWWTGITNVSRGNNVVRIYPNPAMDVATLDITLVNDGKVTVNIYDINGRLVSSKNLGHVAAGTLSHKIDCSSLSHGMYLVNVVSGNAVATSKLVVK